MSFYSMYRWCIVPNCNNSTSKTPEKLFIKVPNDIYMRNVWLELSGRDPTTLSTKSILYLCEDHFDLEQHMENYMQYKIMGSVKKIRMKPNAIPSKFSHSIQIVRPAESTATSTCLISPTSFQGTGRGYVPHDPPSGSIYEVETSADTASVSPVHVKKEPECTPDPCELPLVKEEAEFVDEEVCVKEEEWSDSGDGRGVSEAAMLAGLYSGHEVKDELVLGPERPHRPTVAGVTASALVSSAAAGRGRSCSVRLERLLVDSARRGGRVARRTYKLRKPAPTLKVTTTIYQCHHCGKQFRNKSVLNKHVHTHSPLHDSTGDYLEHHQMLPDDKKPYKYSDNKNTSNLKTKVKCNKKSDLQDYLMIHTDDKPFQCRFCDHRSRRKGYLRIHEMTHGKTPFKCDHCDKKCLTKASLRNHLMIHTGEKPFKCRYCDYKSRHQANLRSHEMTHTDTKPYKCRYCDHRSRQKAHLQTHEMTHTGKAPFKCHHCDKKCITKASFRTHLMIHTGEKPYKCRYCEYSSRQKVTLRVHEIKHASETPFKCNYCDYKCKRKSALLAHEMTHTDEYPFICNYCDCKFKRKPEKKIHMMLHTGEYPFICDYCDRKFKRKFDIKFHIMLHTGENPFKCNYCDYKCKRNTELRIHEMRHTGEKPFKCNYCDYKCIRKGDIRIHEMKHTGEKPFKCNICDYKCKRNGELRAHQIIHRGEKPFKCNYCNYECKRKGDLLAHKMTHSDEYPFICNYCNHKFKRKLEIKRHMIVHTAEE
ncbi:zinc finger protein ZFP2-like isoform X2 [Cydia pomonella]|uniref:zinc finger protein ZFP2-like isoform X2 n=1 Tax=Cydia pomonella TaxID=82600 RepID=UPI002ADE31BD|nr:zinc finger protein ZFP2-like isoform X2 [Cydia pomonella]